VVETQVRVDTLLILRVWQGFVTICECCERIQRVERGEGNHRSRHLLDLNHLVGIAVQGHVEGGHVDHTLGDFEHL